MSDEEGEDGFEWSGRNEETEDEDNCYDVSVGQRAIVTYRDGEECFDEAPLDGEETEDEGHDEDARHSEFIDKSRYDTLTWSFSAAKRQLRVA